MLNFSFAFPEAFILFLLLPFMFYRYKKQKVRVKIPSLKALKTSKKPSFLTHLGFILRVLAFCFLVIALARPQHGQSEGRRRTEALDIMLVVDTSKSMMALDFSVNGKRVDRLEVVKNVLKEFISARIDDRLGLVIFGSEAYARTPLTLDHDVLLQYLDSTQIGMAGDATAIGDGIGVAVNRLKDLESKSKIIILLTDGAQTAGNLLPEQASQAALEKGIKVYTVGIGSKGPVPVQTEMGIQNAVFEIDEEALKKIAETTKAKYFKATNTKALHEIYQTIDQLEKTKAEYEVFHNYEEKYHLFAILAFIVMWLEAIWMVVFKRRRIP